MTADLHLHTHYSDGNWSPKELIDAAIRLGFKCIAITDHDTVAALPESHAYAKGKIRLVNGIEFNTIWKNPEGEDQDVHILGYFIDPDNRQLKEAMDAQQNARNQHLQETIDRLNAEGFKIDIEEVKAAAGKGSIGRPHICAAMLKAGITKDVQQAYRMLMNRDSKTRVVRRSITPEQAISAIATAGGISSLAHPCKEPHIPELVETLAPRGLRAIEAYHRSHTLSQIRKFSKLAKSHDLLITGGSDCHGPFEKYPASIGEVRLSADLLQKLDSARV